MDVNFSKAKWMHGDDGLWLMLKVEAPFFQSVKRFCGNMKDRIYTAVLKEYRQKRSLDANAYCWVLIGKLADALHITATEVYQNAIKEIGNNFEIFPIRDDAVDRWVHIWQSKGKGWVCDLLGASKLTGYTNVVNYYGSSVYDTKQMSALIDCVIHECELQGIETATPEELERLKGEWSA